MARWPPVHCTSPRRADRRKTVPGDAGNGAGETVPDFQFFQFSVSISEQIGKFCGEVLEQLEVRHRFPAQIGKFCGEVLEQLEVRHRFPAAARFWKNWKSGTVSTVPFPPAPF